MRRFRSAFVGLSALTMMLAASSPARADAILSLVPSTDIVQVGETVSIDVNLADVTDLFAYQFDILFDPTVLSADLVLEGSFFGSDPTISDFDSGLIDNTLGSISFIFSTFLGDLSGVTGNGTLATLVFTAIGTSPMSTITMSNVLLASFSDPNQFPDSLPFTLTDAQLTTVPEPSSLALMGLGIAALYGRRRRRAAKRHQSSV